MKKWTFCSWRKGVKWFKPTPLTPSLFIKAGEVSLRLPRLCDGETLVPARLRSRREIEAWEPDVGVQDPWEESNSYRQWKDHYKWLRDAYRHGYLMPFVITLNGEPVGQIVLSKIEHGPINGATLGYWVDTAVSGGGVATAAAALAIDYGWNYLGLHRIQATVHPSNDVSKAVLRKLGMQYEGLMRGYFKIKGSYAEHELWALLSEDFPAGSVHRIVNAGKASRWAGRF